MPDNTERLKRDYVESAISLAESFAREANFCLRSGDAETAMTAKGRAEHFCAEAEQMLRLLHDKTDAHRLAAQIEHLRRDLGASKFVA